MRRYQVESGKPEGVFVEIGTSTNYLRAGKDFQLFYRIENRTSQTVTVLPNLFRRNDGFDFASRRGDQVRIEGTRIVDWEWVPKSDDFVRLEPGEGLELSLDVTVGLGVIRTVHGTRIGRYLWFPATKDYLPLGAMNALTVSARYYLIDPEEQTGLNELRIPDLVTQDIESSNSVELRFF